MENTENVEKMPNINHMTKKHFIYDSKHSFCQPDDSKHSFFAAFLAEVEKIITYAYREHDHGFSQNGRTSSEMWSPAKPCVVCAIHSMCLLLNQSYSERKSPNSRS